MWATSVPILVLLGSVLDLGPMYATDKTKASLNVPPIRGGGIITDTVDFRRLITLTERAMLAN